MTAFHYGVRALRLGLAQQVVQTIRDNEILPFWNSYIKKDRSLLYESINELLDIFCARNVCDKRAFALIYDTFTYSIENVDIFYNELSKTYNSPNITALTLMLLNINEYFGQTKSKISKVYHDQQDQFGHELKSVFDIFKNILPDQKPTSYISDLTKSNLFTCDLLLVPSDGTYGLQLADIFLYLFVQKEKNSINLYPKCSLFLDTYSESDKKIEITREQLLFEAKVNDYFINRKKLKPDELLRGKKILEQLVSKRWKSGKL